MPALEPDRMGAPRRDAGFPALETEPILSGFLEEEGERRED